MSVPYLDLGAGAAADARRARGRVRGSCFGAAGSSAGRRWRRSRSAVRRVLRRRYAVGVNSGTDAIELALRALRVGPGDEVITAANTCVATVTGIAATGATPVLADVDPASGRSTRLSARGGHGADARDRAGASLRAVRRRGPRSRELGVPILEDAAQAHGAEYDGGGRRHGGVQLLSDEEPGRARRRAARSSPTTPSWPSGCGCCGRTASGQTARGIAVVDGVNSRLDELQAEILVREVEHGSTRGTSAGASSPVLSGAGSRARRSCSRSRPKARSTAGTCSSSWSRIATRSARRLRERGVETLVHYPEPIHQQAAYAHLPRVEVPVAERLCAQVVSLPLYPELTDAEAEQVVQAVLAVEVPSASPRSPAGRSGSTSRTAGRIRPAAGPPRASPTRTRASGRTTSPRSRRRSRSASTTRRPRC